MFEDLVSHSKRLFSSKNNAGKLVKCKTAQLHLYKLVLLAMSIVILLGYSQFREHFRCMKVGNFDERAVTNFCWVNGTSTVDLREGEGGGFEARGGRNGSAGGGRRARYRGAAREEGAEEASLVRRIIPHVGIQFKWHDHRYEVVSHNYMRSLWGLLLLMAALSYLGQRAWAALFSGELLQALLRLPEHEKLAAVQAAQRAKPLETLMRLPSERRRKQQPALLQLVDPKDELYDSIALFNADNHYNHLLDYYPNQLIYLLMAEAGSGPARKLAGLRLKRKLLCYQLLSSALTLAQFLLPLLAIGNKYALYGWHYLRAMLRYTWSQLQSSPQEAAGANSIDYELSARIWPTVTKCQFQAYGVGELDQLPTQCFVPINEICAKLFVAIWWFVALNILLELYQLSLSLINLASSNFLLIRWQLPRECRRAIQEIASFRQRHSETLERILRADRGRSSTIEKKKMMMVSGKQQHSSKLAKARQADHQRQASRAADYDEDIFYYFYLLLLRLDCSRRQTREVAMMTNDALNRYMENLTRLEVNSGDSGAAAAAE